VKLPKQFRGGDLNGMLKDLKESVEKAEAVEAQLKDELITRETPLARLTMDGTGRIVSIVELKDGEVLPHTVLLRVVELLAGEAFDIATQRRQALTEEVLGNIPG
jgi:hypothetical protein